jgi:hypothetical protein
MSILPAPRATSLRAAPAATLDPDSTHRAFSLAEDAVVFQRMVVPRPRAPVLTSARSPLAPRRTREAEAQVSSASWDSRVSQPACPAARRRAAANRHCRQRYIVAADWTKIGGIIAP